MKKLTLLLSAAFWTFLGFALTAGRAAADTPGQHPYYLHALSDLRDARAHLDKLTPSEVVDEKEVHAIAEVDKAIGEIKKASIDDGKDLSDHPPVDAKLDKKGRLHHAVELLEKAKQDVDHEEDNKFAKGLRGRANDHIKKAIKIVKDHLLHWR